MHRVSTPDIRRTARRASRSRTAHFLARAGLNARGVLYILVGWVAVLVGAIGLVIIVSGVALVVEGARQKFMKHLQTARTSARTRRVVKVLGKTGTIARGLVFALAGALVVDAAVTHRAAKSGGIDKALLTLRDQPFGEFLMMLAALGLLAFGIYGLCEARWRKV